MFIRLFLVIIFLLLLPGIVFSEEEDYVWEKDFEVCSLYQEGCSNFPHIKTFGLLYGGYFTRNSETYAQKRQDILNEIDPEGEYDNLYHWFAHHYDLTSNWGGGSRTDFTQYNPDIESWKYMTLGGLGYILDAGPDINLLSKKFLEAQEYADTLGADFEDFFVHFATNKSFPCSFAGSCGASYESVLENVVLFQDDEYTDWTYKAFGYRWGDEVFRENYYLEFGKDNSIIYFGKINRFTELHINLSEEASSDWKGVWEYWNGSDWETLTLKSDTTNELQQSGIVKFLPPTDWSQSTIAEYNLFEFNGLYYLRLRTTSQGTTQPVAHTYQLAPGGALQNVPASGGAEAPGVSAFHAEIYLPRTDMTWDFSPEDESRDRGTAIDMTMTFLGWSDDNDQNGDGYVDDAEFASLIDPTATARMKHQSRSAAYLYQYMNWGANYQNSDYRDFIVNYNVANFETDEYDGVMFDSLSRNVGSRYWGSEEGTFIEYPGGLYDPDYEESIKQTLIAFQLALPGKAITGNNNGNLHYKDIVDGTEAESYFSLNYTNTATNAGALPTYLTNKFDKVIDAAKQGKIVALMNRMLYLPEFTPERERIFGLASYYLHDQLNGGVYFWYQGNHEYESPWKGWFDAIAYDIGAPDGEYYQWGTGIDPSNSNRQFYIFARDRVNGNKVLVKYKPKSDSLADETTITTHELNGEYYILGSDGILSGELETTVSLRNNEGVILISPLSFPTPTPTPTPTPDPSIDPTPTPTPTPVATPPIVEDPDPTTEEEFQNSFPNLVLIDKKVRQRLKVTCELSDAEKYKIVIRKNKKRVFNKKKRKGKARVDYRAGDKIVVVCRGLKRFGSKLVKSGRARQRISIQ